MLKDIKFAINYIKEHPKEATIIVAQAATITVLSIVLIDITIVLAAKQLNSQEHVVKIVNL